MIMQCTNPPCGKRTTDYEANDRNFRTGKCASCGGELKEVVDGKSQAWRDAADRLLEALARENKYIVGDMLVIFLESAGYGLDDYTPLGGVFKRAAKKGIVSKIDRPTKQALWLSKIYIARPEQEAEACNE